MPSAADFLASKPPLGADLASGVRDLSANQTISFSLYQRYVFPLDGMNYWIKVPPGTVTTPGLQLRKGLTSATKVSGEAVQVAPGGPRGKQTVGGKITNPLVDQDLFIDPAESIFVDFTGPAYCRAIGSTRELAPGESIDIPAGTPAWVNAPTGGHRFTVVLHEKVEEVSLPTDVTVEGSFHYDSMTDQRADATVDSNTVVFTSLSEIQPFNQIGPNHLYIGSYRDLRFAFASRGYLYEQADLYHYVGKAIYSVTETQIIEDIADFSPGVFNSNSIPIWMYMNYYEPPYPTFVCPFPLYPAFLVDDNTPTPFGAVHVERTDALAFSPALGPRMQADRLCRDHVVVHIYGADNRMVSDFREFVDQYSYDWNTIGIASLGAIVDINHTQPELKVIAKRKSITFDVNYLQSVSRDTARQYIEKAKIQWYPQVPGLDLGVTPHATDDLFATLSR